MLLGCEMKMKCMRMDSALDQIGTIIKANKANYKTAVGRALIGTRVITKYNNRTYCVDDIVWDKNPQTTFPDRVSFMVNFLGSLNDYFQVMYFTKEFSRTHF